MKNLIQFFRKYRYFFVFVVIQFILLRFYFDQITYPRSVMFSVSNSFNSWFYEKQTAISDYWNLQEMNDRLTKENLKLKQSEKINFIPLQNDVFYAKDQMYHQQYEYIGARVINGPYQQRNNFFTVNRGSIHGVQKNMAVFNDQGVVGFVVNSSKHFALVKTLLTESFNVSAQLKKNNEHGLIKWNGRYPGTAQLRGVPKDVTINRGDTIITKGSAGIFPENIMVGTVKSVSTKPGVPEAIIDFNTAVDFSSVYQVYIVKNKLSTEKEQLEEKIPVQDE